MEAEVTTELVDCALNAFYHGPADQQRAANELLTSAQVSPGAWSFCWDLLAREGQTVVQFFGACTLHVKLSRFWKELPPDKYQEVKVRLLEEIAKSLRDSSAKMVFSKLCAALAVFAVQTCPDIWPDTVQSLVAALEEPGLRLTTEQSRLAILEALTALPEEFPSVHVDQYRRSLIRNELSVKGSPFVLQILQSLFNACQNAPVEQQSHYTNQCVAGIKCFSAWVVLGLPIENVRPILPHLFAAMRSEPLFESAADALVHVASHPEMNKFPTIWNEIVASTLLLNDLLQQALQSRDTDAALHLGRIVVTLAETNTGHLLDRFLRDSPSGDSGVGGVAHNHLLMILSCSRAPGFFGVDELVSELPFPFWYSFQDEIVSANEEKRATLMIKAQTVYMSLVEIFLEKVQFPSDAEYLEWSNEDKELFRCYRQDVSDTILYAYNILGESMLRALVSAIDAAAATAAGAADSWQKTEAALFLFAATAEGVERHYSQNVEVLLRLLPRLPSMREEPRLVDTALHLVGGFAEWLSAHPEPLLNLVPLFLEALGEPAVLEPATFALKDVCREAKRHLAPVAPDILSAAHTALRTPGLKSREQTRIIAACGYLLSALPPAAVLEHLNTLLAPHLDQVWRIVSSPASTPPAEKKLIVSKLEMLGSLYTTISSGPGGESEGSEDEASHQTEASRQTPETHGKTVLVVQSRLQELMEKILAKYLDDEVIVEGVCELLQRCCRSLLEEFGPLVESTTRLVGELFPAAPHASMIHLASQVTLVHHNEASHVDRVASMFGAISSECVRLFQPPGAIGNLPDTAQAFLTYLATVFRKCPTLVQRCSVVPDGGVADLAPLVHCGLVGLELPEAPTAKAACGLLVELASQSNGACEAVRRVVRNEGLVVLEATLLAIAGGAARSLADPLADVIFALARNQVELTRRWLETLLVEREAFPNSRVTPTQKQHFLKSVFKSNKRRVKEIVKEFSLACRGLVGTEYGNAQRRVDQLFM